MDMIKLKINGIEVTVPKGSTILEAAKVAGIRIPTLCWLKDLNEIGACRVCVVEVKGARNIVAACVYPANDGMEVLTNTPLVRQSRKDTLELMLSEHRKDCLSCSRSLNCELQALSHEYGVSEYAYPPGESENTPFVDATDYLVRDNSKCILCRRCVAVCRNNQHVGVIGAANRGFEVQIRTAFDVPLSETPCVCCGQCIVVCPTGALIDRDDTNKVWRALADEKKHVVVATAPSVRAQLGESFGMPVGTNVEGKMAAALRRMGFDKVFDVDTAADITVMEEATEFLHRFTEGGVLPLITSCSPGWVKFCEHYYPDMLAHLSSCKSPQGMYGALMKTYYAEKEGIDPKDIFVVSVMPCVAKKFEIKRDDMSAAGYPDVDVVVSTREIAQMIKQSGIIFEELPDEKFDPAFGVATGAGHIFGTTGGVMEAALRTAAETITKQPLTKLEFECVRGIDSDIKLAEYELDGNKIRVAVTSGIANAKKLLDMVKNKEIDVHFIEVMGCSGGCVNGGGAPVQPGFVRSFTDLRTERAKVLYSIDDNSEYRKSHDNPVVKELYETYLKHPGSDKAHHLLHTTYVPRKVYK